MKRLLLLLPALLLGLAAFTFKGQEVPDPEKAIPEIIARQAACWNEGDIACFMEDYWHSDSLRFIGKNGIKYGWQTTYDNYLKSYPDKATMGHLDLELLSLERTGPETCFVIGTWHIDREAGEIGGHFTLLWRLMDNKWVIVADHSS